MLRAWWILFLTSLFLPELSAQSLPGWRATFTLTVFSQPGIPGSVETVVLSGDHKGTLLRLDKEQMNSIIFLFDAQKTWHLDHLRKVRWLSGLEQTGQELPAFQPSSPCTKDQHCYQTHFKDPSSGLSFLVLLTLTTDTSGLNEQVLRTLLHLMGWQNQSLDRSGGFPVKLEIQRSETLQPLVLLEHQTLIQTTLREDIFLPNTTYQQVQVP